MIWRRTALVVAALVAVLVLAAGSLAAWLLTTDAGARAVVSRLVDMTGSVLTAETVSGSLAEGLRLEGLRFSIDRVEATADEATATFDLRQLLRRQVVIRDLYVSRVTVVPQPADEDADPGPNEPFAAPALPVGIVLESIAVEGVDLAAGESIYDFGQLTLTVSYIDRVAAVSRFEARLRDYNFSTQATFDLTGQPVVAATLSAAGRYQENDVLIGAEIFGELPVVTVEAELLEPATLTATGPVTLNAGPAFDLEIVWAAIDPGLLASLGAPAGVGIGAGTARVAGDPNAVDVTAATTLNADGAQIQADASARYTPALIELIGLELARDQGAVQLDGTLDPATMDFVLNVDGDGVDPAWYAADWSGDIALQARLSGRLAETWRVRAEDVALDGTLRGQVFTATAAASMAAGGGLDIESAAIRIGNNSLSASGQVGQDLDLGLDVEAELVALSEVVDGMQGALTAAVTISGAIEQPRVEGDAALTGFAYNGVRIETAGIGGRVDLGGQTTWDLDLNAAGVEAGAAIFAVAGTVDGTVDAHTAAVTITGDAWQADGRVDGALVDEQSWAGTVASLNYEQMPFGQWSLSAPAALELTPGRINLEEACLGQGSAALCLGLEYGADVDGHLRVRASELDLDIFEPLMPENIRASGRYEVDVDVTGPRTSPLGTMQITGGPTRLTYARSEDETVTTEFSSVSLDAQIDLDSFESTAAIVGGGNDGIRLTLSGLRQPDDSVGIEGRLDASWADIGPLTVLNQDVDDVAGQVSAAIDIGGTLDQPTFDGRATLEGGRVGIPLWGVTAESISGTASSNDGESVEFAASATIDGAELRLEGRTELAADAGWPTRFTLSGDDVPLVQVADADLVVTPELEIDVDLPRIDVSGTVDVPRGLISVSQLPEQAVRPSADTLVHGIELPERASPILLTADIELRLGDDVRYEGAGLLADLGGNLRVRYASGTTASASGTLSVTGMYEAFGQELTLERGELIFTGPMTNPTLNVRAVRRVDDITVGIDLTGSLEAPVSRIFSDPIMAEADAVSYLLFGRPLAVPEGGGDPDQLRNAAVSLGLRQAVPVIQRIGDSLGLDEFAIESTNVDAGELMAGKYLSPKLYVRYSYGLFNRIGGLLLQYQVNDKISIETRSGDQKSMDIMYTIERN